MKIFQINQIIYSKKIPQVPLKILSLVKKNNQLTLTDTENNIKYIIASLNGTSTIQVELEDVILLEDITK